MLRLFRVVEFNWKFDVKKKMKGRRVFFSYPYVYYQICVHMGLRELTGTHHLLKDRSLMYKQHCAYRTLARRAKLSCDFKTYR